MPSPAKEIVCADALEWLRGCGGDVGAVVTSLPDAEEIDRPVSEWGGWFETAVGLCIAAASPAAPAIFYQTDRKADGAIASKASFVLGVARAMGARVLWHKIVLRGNPGTTDLYRPGFTHLIAVSRTGSAGRATPDVIERGPMLYDNAMGLRAAGFAVRFAGHSARRIVDPFCGRGTVPAVAVANGLDALGIDIDPDQCAAAVRLKLTRIEKGGAPEGAAK